MLVNKLSTDSLEVHFLHHVRADQLVREVPVINNITHSDG